MNCHYCNGFNCKLWRRAGELYNPLLICAYCIRAVYEISLTYIRIQNSKCLNVDKGNPFIYVILDKNKEIAMLLDVTREDIDDWLALPLEPTVYRFHLPPLLTEIS